MRILSAIALSFLLSTTTLLGVEIDQLEQEFRLPPDSARPWVYWFWINGNISREGITADLEAFQRQGIGGVLWMEVSGPWWAPDGKVVALSREWHDAIQWAIQECQRLGLAFDMALDFGYGSGGPHIAPDRSMQKLVWSETIVQGGQAIDQVLDKAQFEAVSRPLFPPNPNVEVTLQAGDRQQTTTAWLRPGAQLSDTMLQAIARGDAYRDVAVVAVPQPASAAARDFRIADLDAKAGLHATLIPGPGVEPPPTAITAPGQVIDLTAHMDPAGRLQWDAPPGEWLILRYGHDTNLKLTRPCPAAAVGLECDRLSPLGIESHFAGFLKPILEGAGSLAGRSWSYAHIDSWEAGCQNWTAAFPAEFRARRGYDLTRWLPVLSGRVVGSAEMSERFLWDVRSTVSELIQEHYAARFRELLEPYGLQLSIEAYGHLCIDSLAYAGVSHMPVSEFWAQGTEKFPQAQAGGYQPSSKVMASAAHTYGRQMIGAEAFTSGRGWRDHPYLLKGMGDQMFCAGVNRMILCLAVHQPYADMMPGLTHRRWGEHFHRYNTWWAYSRPWMDYLARCQYLLQQGQFVADFCYWPGEGAPLSVYDMELTLEQGYDYDICATELLLELQVRDGRLVLPSGMSYGYLLLRNTDRLTLRVARKIQQLVEAGAKVIALGRPQGSPSLMDDPQDEVELERLVTALWDTGRVISGKPLPEVLAADGLEADFTGPGLRYLHRRLGDCDIYFVAHPQDAPGEVNCTFRVTGKIPELWDPETGQAYALTDYQQIGARTVVALHFEPLQSWFVVFRPEPGAGLSTKPWMARETLRPVTDSWQVTFDPRWGGPTEPVTFPATLCDWREHSDMGIRYYSGTAIYRQTFELAPSELSDRNEGLWLNLGRVEVMAQVRLNGKDCGIVWKPPYRVPITDAVRPGQNHLEIAVVNLWINRLIGDEQLPVDSTWKDFETLAQWPAWFQGGQPRPSGRYTFTTCKHYQADTPLAESGLLGPVHLEKSRR